MKQAKCLARYAYKNKKIQLKKRNSPPRVKESKHKS